MKNMEIKVKYEENPSKRHMISALRDLQKYDLIAYKALGKAISTLQMYKQHFIDEDIG